MQFYTVVPRLTTTIRSRKIAVKRNRHQTKKKPLECIENRSMRSNGEIPLRPAKIAHRELPISCLKTLSSEEGVRKAAILRREGSYFTKGSHFAEPEKLSFSKQTVREAGS